MISNKKSKSFQTEMVAHLAKENLKLMMDYSKIMVDESPLDRKTAVLFIGEFTRLVLTEVLRDHPLQFEGKSLYNHVYKNYSQTKDDIETLIGLAFTFAVKRFSGKNMDYVCEISPVPSPNNKTDV